MNIWQPKKEDEKHFIHLAARVDLDKELRSSVAKLSAKKRQHLLSELRIELIRFRIGYEIRQPLENIWIKSRVPIVWLTEWELLEQVRFTDGAIILVTEKFNLFFATQ